MKVNAIRVGRVKSVDYQSRKIEIEIELEEGDKLEEVQEAADLYIAMELGELPRNSNLKVAKKQLKEATRLNKILGRLKK